MQVLVGAARRRLPRQNDREPAAWAHIDVGDLSDLASNVAGLPSETEREPEEAKRFDLLMLSLELALLRTEPGFPRLQQQVRQIADLLEEYASIPAVAKDLALIHEVQSDEWWTDVTLPMVEGVRRRLRLLVQFIEKGQRAPLYTDFEDQIGEQVDVEFRELASADDFERFRRKTRTFLAEHQGQAAIDKIQRNELITADDIADLQ